jgi:hypothetical protein
MPDRLKHDSLALQSRRHWRPTPLTVALGLIFMVVLIIAIASGGFAGFLIFLSLIALGTALYMIVTKRPSWLNLPRSRGLGLVIAGASLVVLVVGGSIGASAAHVPHSAVSHSAAAPQPQSPPVLTDFTQANEAKAQSKLLSSGYRVVIVSASGTAPADLVGWTVESQDPPAGQTLAKGGVVTLTVAPPVASPTPSVTPSATPTPPPVAPAAPVAPPVPAAPAAPVAPPPPPPAQSSGTVIPGAFCSPSQIGAVGVASNGHSYICGGKGPDASGHYHWNS